MQGRNPLGGSNPPLSAIETIKKGVDEKGGSDAEPAGEALSRGRGNLRATASELSVTAIVIVYFVTTFFCQYILYISRD